MTTLRRLSVMVAGCAMALAMGGGVASAQGTDTAALENPRYCKQIHSTPNAVAYECHSPAGGQFRVVGTCENGSRVHSAWTRIPGTAGVRCPISVRQHRVEMRPPDW